MSVDSSALIAVITGEADAPEIAARLLSGRRCIISAVNYAETAVVADARQRRASRAAAFGEMMQMFRLEIAEVNFERAEAARQAYRQFGKGYHPARLNFGDCFAYALAKELAEPLLFKGNDFACTDVERAA